MDIKNIITFGASFYDINQPDFFGAHPFHMTQLYHVSLLLFKKKAIQVERYFILKKQNFTGIHENYFEVGAYRSYMFISLHTAARVFTSGFGREYNGNENDWSIIAGLSFTYKKMKFGYTIYNDGDTGHELYASFNFLNISQAPQRNLMMN